MLVGTNPLPDFVVAEYLLNNNSSLREIFLLYSEETQLQRGTKAYADNLQKILMEHHGEKNLIFHEIPLADISSAQEIERDLKKKLAKKLKTASSVHLNYTGGTKAMGIHVYRWFEGYSKETNITATFSYLDARTFQIVTDSEGRITDDLRNHVKLNLNELLTLHGFKKEKVVTDEINLFNDAMTKFKEKVDQCKIADYFHCYKRESFVDEKGRLIRTIKDFKKNLEKNTFKPQGAFLEIVLALPEDYRIFDNNGLFKEPKSNRYLEKTIEFLDGKWLEKYVYDVLKTGLCGDNVTIDMNWEMKKPTWSSPNQRFELDVILMKGYQLIGISCTTASSKHLCKSKGFEIFMRTRQIGGEEARAVLVTRLSNSHKDELQAELEVDTGGKENILVLGADDLKDYILVERMRDFMR